MRHAAHGIVGPRAAGSESTLATSTKRGGGCGGLDDEAAAFAISLCFLNLQICFAASKPCRRTHRFQSAFWPFFDHPKTYVAPAAAWERCWQRQQHRISWSPTTTQDCLRSRRTTGPLINFRHRGHRSEAIACTTTASSFSSSTRSYYQLSLPCFLYSTRLLLLEPKLVGLSTGLGVLGRRWHRAGNQAG